ncbi:hypothetical protein Q1695_001687 [Nippostrongylus brasiliensis]|nr:hypothetical protein Q1695_001687 [Nippostrongylus brasiliensis]
MSCHVHNKLHDRTPRSTIQHSCRTMKGMPFLSCGSPRSDLRTMLCDEDAIISCSPSMKRLAVTFECDCQQICKTC